MAFRSATALASAGTQTTAVINVPAGAAIDDIALVGIYIESAAVITAPSGFTSKIDLGTSPTARGRLNVFWKRLTAADTGTYSFSWTGSTFRAATAGLWSGRITTGDPFDGTPGSNETTSAATTAPATATASVAGGDGVLMATSFTGTGQSWTPPASYTERIDNTVIMLDSRDAMSSGSTGSIGPTAVVSDFIKHMNGILLPAATAYPFELLTPTPRYF